MFNVCEFNFKNYILEKAINNYIILPKDNKKKMKDAINRDYTNIIEYKFEDFEYEYNEYLQVVKQYSFSNLERLVPKKVSVFFQNKTPVNRHLTIKELVGFELTYIKKVDFFYNKFINNLKNKVLLLYISFIKTTGIFFKFNASNYFSAVYILAVMLLINSISITMPNLTTLINLWYIFCIIILLKTVICYNYKQYNFTNSKLIASFHKKNIIYFKNI